MAATIPPRRRGGRLGVAAAASVLAVVSCAATRSTAAAFCSSSHLDAMRTRCARNGCQSLTLRVSLQSPPSTKSRSPPGWTYADDFDAPVPAEPQRGTAILDREPVVDDECYLGKDGSADECVDFDPLASASTARRPSLHTIPSHVIPFPTSSADDVPQQSHVLSVDDMGPALQFRKNGKLKVLNLTGVYHLAVVLLTMPFWMLAMEILHRMGDAIEGFDEHRAKFDYSGKVWCRTYLHLTNCYPEIAGDVDRLKANANNGACLFVANHASFLDIAVLCCVLDPVFKFIAKDSLKEFPGVGMQLTGGEHVLIDRSNKRSQLRSFKDAVNYLKEGIPIMAFPEGARSPDGRLMEFKGGIFSMAVKAGVPIVPLSLANTHAVMPSEGLLPVQSGRGKLRVYVHEAIGVEGKTEEEIAKEVRAALLSELPPDQHPLEEL